MQGHIVDSTTAEHAHLVAANPRTRMKVIGSCYLKNCSRTNAVKKTDNMVMICDDDTRRNDGEQG